MATRLAPTITPDTQFFWDAAKERKLVIQRCASCGALRHPPRPMCPRCRSLEWEAVDASGRGSLYSFVMPLYPQYPWFEYPYVVALVELEEGTRIVTNVVGAAPETLTIGMPVEVCFEEFDDGLVLPQFTPAGAR